MVVTDNTSPVAQEPSAFETAVRERSWDWLLELRRRLKVDLQLVDKRYAPLLPFTVTGPAANVSILLEQGEPVLRTAVSTAVQSRHPQTAAVHGLQIVCLGLAMEPNVSGALVIARALPAGQDLDASRSQLQLVGSWLSTAIEAHLQSPPAFHASGINRLAPLARLLAQAAERESDRELVRLFGEAIAVWHDIEMSGYIEVDDETFVRDVSLPGARTTDRPPTISAVGLPDTTADLTRLPQGHLDRFGLPVGKEVYVRRFRRRDGRSWLLVFTGEIGAQDLQRLGAYVSLLECALALATSEASSRVMVGVSRRLTNGDDALEMRAARALEELRVEVGASSATLTIESAGAPLLRVATPEGSTHLSPPGSPRLVMVTRSERHYTTTISVARTDSLQFTPRDRDVVNAAASMFVAWAPVALRAAAGSRDRRAVPRGFHEVIERSAREALELGSPVAVVVLLVRDAVFFPGATQRWVTGMRGQLRPLDLAGTLAEGEIGLLMHDTTAHHAKAIAERLRGVVGASFGAGPILIGVAIRAPGSGSADGLVREARTDALGGEHSPTDAAYSNGVRP
ncbi:MAG TPA: hypothetical protein VGF24_04485 [Vicinamibacterales bacterium]|jgi:hypothetical protein